MSKTLKFIHAKMLPFGEIKADEKKFLTNGEPSDRRQSIEPGETNRPDVTGVG